MTAEALPPQPFANTAKLGDVAGLALKNAFFNIITLTLYRFWARTAIRRRLWSRTWVMGDPLEYTGTGWELFRGFLVALPTFFIPAIFVFYIAPLVTDPITAGWLTLGFYILAVPLIAAARFWMRRYQLSRTRWRGIRLGLAGSAWGFAAASWGWSILESLSLGWYGPVARLKRAKLLWENARFGDQPFEFVPDSKPLAEPLWWPFALGWFGWLASYLITIGVVFSVVAALGLSGVFGNGENPQTPDLGVDPQYIPLLILGGAAPIFLICLALFWAPYNAAAMNRIASLIQLDGARFKLKAKSLSLFFITVIGWTLIILSLGFLAPVAGMIQVRYILNRLEIIGTPRFAEIGQSIVAAPEVGEGIADAFDLDMGVGVL